MTTSTEESTAKTTIDDAESLSTDSIIEQLIPCSPYKEPSSILYLAHFALKKALGGSINELHYVLSLLNENLPDERDAEKSLILAHGFEAMEIKISRLLKIGRKLNLPREKQYEALRQHAVQNLNKKDQFSVECYIDDLIYFCKRAENFREELELKFYESGSFAP